MDKLYWLNEIQPSCRTQVGDKAFNLGMMMQHGYPIIPGFVIAADILHEYLENKSASQTLVSELADSSLHLDIDDWRQLQQVALHLRQEIMNSSLPDGLLEKIYEAVKKWNNNSCLVFRPSVAIKSAKFKTENISGLYESIFCRSEEKEISLALKRIWTQLFSARSLLYWQKSDIKLYSVNLAVLVQPVSNVVASGVLDANTSRWEIQGNWGLGVAIDWGEVEPDVYYIKPKTGVLSEQHLGSKLLAYRCENTAINKNEAYLENTQKSLVTLEKQCLQISILEEELQQQQVLSPQYLQQITELAHQLVCQLGKDYLVKWTFIEEAESEKLYLTKINKPINTFSQNSSIKGISAAKGRALANALVIENHFRITEQVPKGIILVASSITPDWLPLLQQVGGIVTEKGGLTSHAAIIARELGIPAVVAVNNVTKLIQNGDRLLIDGDNGEVHYLPKNIDQENIDELIAEDKIPASDSAANNNTWVSSVESISYPFTNLPMTSTQLMVNLSQPTMIDAALSLPVDGVGLLRSEIMVLSILNQQNPLTWIRDGRREKLLDLWTKKILEFVRAFSPKPIYYRSLDWRKHELPSLNDEQGEIGEVPTALGQRGTFSYLLNPEVFDLELAALHSVQEAGYDNIRLILPFVRTVEEFSFCRQKVEEAGLNKIREFQLWIMAEVPSVLLLLPEYVKAGVQGISIGTNDLTQLLLGVDRDQAVLAKSFDERHPVVMDAISRLIQMSRKAGIPCSICGQAPVLYPEIITKLVEWGITSISVEPQALQQTYQAIFRAEQTLLLEAARRQLSKY